jgi:hypothetical protein
MIDKAILKINPNAKFSISSKSADIDNVDKSTIEWLENTTPISKADIKTKIVEVQAEIEQEKQDTIAKKASGKQKLLDLGLSEEEVKALIGI